MFSKKKRKDIEERKIIQKEKDALREILNGDEFDKDIELRSCDDKKDQSLQLTVIMKYTLCMKHQQQMKMS